MDDEDDIDDAAFEATIEKINRRYGQTLQHLSERNLPITPVPDSTRRAMFEATLAEFDQEYGDVFRRLAE